MADKFRNGAFVFFRAVGIDPRTPDDCKRLARDFELPEDLVPTYPGDQIAFDRAILRSKVGLKNSNSVLLRGISRERETSTVIGVVTEEKNPTTNKVYHKQVGIIVWRVLSNGQVEIVGENGIPEILEMAKSNYAHFVGCVVADDWTKSVSAFLRNQCNGAAVRDDGRVYWVPPQDLDKVYKFREFLSKIGMNLICCEIESENIGDVKDIATDTVANELEKLREEVEGFSGKEREATFEGRIEQIELLRQRALMYRDALGVGVDRATTLLGELEEKVENLLNYRKCIIVKKDGSTEPKDMVFANNGDILFGGSIIGSWSKEGKEFTGSLTGIDKPRKGESIKQLKAKLERAIIVHNRQMTQEAK